MRVQTDGENRGDGLKYRPLMTRARSIAVLVFGILSCSVSPVLIRLSAMPPVWLTSARLAIAVAALLPLWVAAVRAHPGASLRAARQAILPGVMLALHFVTWIAGVRLVPLAHSSLIVNLSPVVMPFFMYSLIRERVRPGEWAGIGLAALGLGGLAWADARGSGPPVMGDLVCFISMIFMTAYLALGRRNRDIASPWLYVVPLYAVASAVCLPWARLDAGPPPPSWGREVLCILGLGLIPTVLGHSSLLVAVRWIGAQTVSLVNLVQFILAALWGYALFREVPGAAFYPAGALMLAGAVVALLSSGRVRLYGNRS